MRSGPARSFVLNKKLRKRALDAWLTGHREECLRIVERWMLHSWPVPTLVVLKVWVDPDWRASLENVVVMPLSGDGLPCRASVGFLRDVSPSKGVGVMDLDGESRWLATPALVIPHPARLQFLNELRELAEDLSIEQGLVQLRREVWPVPALLEEQPDQPARTSAYAGGHFEMLRDAVAQGRRLGFRLAGPDMICDTTEPGEGISGRQLPADESRRRSQDAGWTDVVGDSRVIRARLHIGDGDPELPSATGDLRWGDVWGRHLSWQQLGPVAYSEGVRMARSLLLRSAPREKGG